MPKRVTPEKEQRILEDYAAGFTKLEITRRNHCSQRTLNRIRIKHGLARRFSLTSLPFEVHKAVVADYLAGLQVWDLIKKHEISLHAFYYILSMNDIPRRDWHLDKEGKKRRLRSRQTKLNEKAIVKAYSRGLSLREIFSSWGATRADVSRCLRRAGKSPDRNLEKAKREELYARLYKQQRGRCAICGRAQKEEGKRLALDHDHQTGKIRGLLCRLCNTGLGSFQDSESRLLKAKRYLEMKHDH
jgi:hypothetical protein